MGHLNAVKFTTYFHFIEREIVSIRLGEGVARTQEFHANHAVWHRLLYLTRYLLAPGFALPGSPSEVQMGLHPRHSERDNCCAKCSPRRTFFGVTFIISDSKQGQGFQ